MISWLTNNGTRSNHQTTLQQQPQQQQQQQQKKKIIIIILKKCRDWSYLPARPRRSFRKGISLDAADDASSESCSSSSTGAAKSAQKPTPSQRPLRRLSWFLPPDNPYKAKGSSKLKTRTLSVDHSDDEPHDSGHVNGVLNTLRSSFRHYTSARNRKEIGS